MVRASLRRPRRSSSPARQPKPAPGPAQPATSATDIPPASTSRLALDDVLTAARSSWWEQAGCALDIAIRCVEHARIRGDEAVNDRYGHQAGDAVLVRVADMLSGHLRAEDTVVRTGGEEFVLLMPGTSRAESTACCERLCEMIPAGPWDGIAPGLTVSASIGVVSAPDARDLPRLERLADERLYAAKRAGRNRVHAGP